MQKKNVGLLTYWMALPTSPDPRISGLKAYLRRANITAV